MHFLSCVYTWENSVHVLGDIVHVNVGVMKGYNDAVCGVDKVVYSQNSLNFTFIITG